MKIRIENRECELREGTPLAEYIEELGLDSESMETKPLAAKLGGEIFNLMFVPKRECELSLVTYMCEEGRRVYERTLQFVLIMAIRKLFPEARVLVQYSMGQGVYITVRKQPTLCDEDIELIRSEMNSIAERGLGLQRHRYDIREALEYFERDGQADKAELLKWRKFNYFDMYSCPEYSDYKDYFYGEMAPNTGYVKVFDLHRIDDSLVMLLPDYSEPVRASKYEDSPKLLGVFRESDKWGRFMTCATAAELNRRVEDGSIRELIRVNEALHEKNFSKVAEDIISHGAKAILIAGPSSSGKTTSAHRLATQLRASGLDPVMLSLDDYYIDRDKVERDANGNIDLEHINAIDTDRFVRDLDLLIKGVEVSIPNFNFKTGKSEIGNNILRLRADQPVIIEGIHGLNPRIIRGIDPSAVYRIYVSALTTLNLDDHNRIHTTDLRLLRRLVRDYENRGASMEHTLGMWPSVRSGETRWIFPYQENADCIINTTLHYEVAVMKKHIYPLLTEVPPESPYYCRACEIVKFLNYFVSADVEDEIPPTSIIREFIGGNSFYND